MGCRIFRGSGTLSFYDELDEFETLQEAFGGDGKKRKKVAHG
jgi:hypothetical protein